MKLEQRGGYKAKVIYLLRAGRESGFEPVSV